MPSNFGALAFWIERNLLPNHRLCQAIVRRKRRRRQCTSTRRVLRD